MRGEVGSTGPVWQAVMGTTGPLCTGSNLYDCATLAGSNGYYCATVYWALVVCLVLARSDGPKQKLDFTVVDHGLHHLWKFEASATLDLVAISNFGFESLQYCNVL